MKIGYYGIALLLIMALGICGVLFLFPVPKDAVDVAKINDMIQSGNTIDKAAFSDMLEQWQIYRKNLQISLIAILVLLTGISAVFLFILRQKILQPFQQMRGFAQRVAAGELDIPLLMDKENAFGAFTESFDLMREELRRAKENERAAEQSKRELVASLSHDIQTPLSSIKAVAELMEVTADQNQRQKLQTIQQKTAQIQTLIADLFHTTLEELNSLRVNPISYPSDMIGEMVKEADYLDKAIIGAIPECLILADPVRLLQVIDNIITNSYKYADTLIEVSAKTDEDGLTLTFRDYGQGVGPEELPLLFSKYYRGKAAAGISGYGLGLFISRILTERMGGRLECENADPGFLVRIWLKFDG